MQDIACRTSYTINEIAGMRSISEQAVLDDIYHGQLKAHVWLPIMVVEEMKRQKIENQILYCRTEKTYEGYVLVYPKDVRNIMRSSRAAIRIFPGKHEDEEIIIRHGSPDYWFKRNDIVILDESLSHLKLKQNRGDIRVTAMARLADIIPDLQRKARPAHDPNFNNVVFNGQEFAFGLVQADILKQLYKAASAGDPKVHFKRLFVEAGSQSMRMRDVFKSQPDWKELICHDSRGYYWLHPDFIVALNTTSSPF